MELNEEKQEQGNDIVIQKPVFEILELQNNRMKLEFGAEGDTQIFEANYYPNSIRSFNSYSLLKCILTLYGLRDCDGDLEEEISGIEALDAYWLEHGKSIVSTGFQGRPETTQLWCGSRIHFEIEAFPVVKLTLRKGEYVEVDSDDWSDIKSYYFDWYELAQKSLAAESSFLSQIGLAGFKKHWFDEPYELNDLIKLADIITDQNTFLPNDFIHRMLAIYEFAHTGSVTRNHYRLFLDELFESFSQFPGFRYWERLERVCHLNQGQTEMLFELLSSEYGSQSFSFGDKAEPVFIDCSNLCSEFPGSFLEPLFNLHKNKEKEGHKERAVAGNDEYGSGGERWEMSYQIDQWPNIHLKIEFHRYSQNISLSFEEVFRGNINFYQLTNAVVLGSLEWLLDNNCVDYSLGSIGYLSVLEFPFAELIELSKILIGVDDNDELNLQEELALLELILQFNEAPASHEWQPSDERERIYLNNHFGSEAFKSEKEAQARCAYCDWIDEEYKSGFKTSANVQDWTVTRPCSRHHARDYASINKYSRFQKRVPFLIWPKATWSIRLVHAFETEVRLMTDKKELYFEVPHIEWDYEDNPVHLQVHHTLPLDSDIDEIYQVIERMYDEEEIGMGDDYAQKEATGAVF